MRATIDPAAHVVQAHTIFRHVLVGVDGTPQSLDALRQAALLKAPGGSISCLAAWDLAPPLLTPMTVVPSQEVADRRHGASPRTRSGARRPSSRPPRPSCPVATPATR